MSPADTRVGPAVGATAGHTSTPDKPPRVVRGRLTIADRVVEKIAAQAVRESVAADALSKAHIHRSHGILALQITLTAPFPAPVAVVSQRIRDQVATRLAELTGYRITRLDLMLDFTLPSKPRERR